MKIFSTERLGRRLVFYFIGLFIMTLGIALSVKSNLGVSPVSSVPAAMTKSWGIEMGNATIILHVAMVILQIILLRKNYNPLNLLQIAVGVIFGKLTTLCNALVAFFPEPANMAVRIILTLVSIVLIAIGIFFYVPADIMPLAGEGLTGAFSTVTKISFSKCKIIMDVTLVVSSLIICLVKIHSFGSVGIGTILAAVLVGTVHGFIVKIFGSWRDKVLGINKISENNENDEEQSAEKVDGEGAL